MSRGYGWFLEGWGSGYSLEQVCVYLGLRPVCGVCAAVAFCRGTLTRRACVHKLIRPNTVDKVIQVLVVKVTRQETWHVDLTGNTETG